MTDPAANTILDFSGLSLDVPIKIITVPDSLTVGLSFEVRLFAPVQYNIHSPYSGVIGGKSIESTAETITETINIGGGVEFPIDSIISVKVANALVSESERVIKYAQGANVTSLFNVVNYSLNTDIDLIGSVIVKYKTFNAQKWEHSAFDFAGAAVLFFQNIDSLAWHPHDLSIGELSESAAKPALKIEGAQLERAYFGVNGVYANFKVFPASAHAKVITDAGTVEKVDSRSGEIWAERLTLNGSLELSAAFNIDSLIGSPAGFFFDKQGNELAVSFYVNDGKLIADKAAYGWVVISYNSAYDYYNYRADVDILSRGDVNTSVGTVMATDGDNIETYDIPEHNRAYRDTVDVLVVSFEILNDDFGDHEKPPNFPTDALFPTSGLEDTDLDLDDARTDKVEVAWVSYDGYSIKEEVNKQRALHPFPFDIYGIDGNPDRVYSIEKNYPENASAELQEDIDAKESELKTEWGIT